MHHTWLMWCWGGAQLCTRQATTLPTQLSSPVLKPKPSLSFPETRSHSVAQAGLELPPECWIYRQELRCLVAPL